MVLSANEGNSRKRDEAEDDEHKRGGTGADPGHVVFALVDDRLILVTEELAHDKQDGVGDDNKRLHDGDARANFHAGRWRSNGVRGVHERLV